MLHPINEYYEKRSHREGWLVMPLVVLGFLIGSAAVMFAAVKLMSMAIDAMPKLDSFIENLLR